MNARELATTVDPYSAWFDIPPDKPRPLNAYQLLGLRELDHELPRIRAAISRRQEQLEQHRENCDAETWSQVAKEVEHAAEILLSLEDKCVLDAQLRRRHSTTKYLAGLTLDASTKITCVNCSTVNGGRRFCSSCGQSLWSICPDCKAVGPAAEPFCGSCGINLQLSRDQALSRAQELLRQAETKAEQGTFQDALRALRPLLTSDDSRLEPVIQEALQMQAAWRAESARQKSRSDHALEVARQHLKQQEFLAAQKVLCKIPEANRSDEFVRLLHDVNIRCQEVRRLEQLIKTSIREKSFDGLGPAIDSLLQLVPQHAQATTLAPQVGRALEQGAAKRLAACRYDQALRLLDEVPQSARGDSYEQMRQQVEEAVWLVNDLRYAARVDSATLHMASRLAKASPENAEAAAWNTQLVEFAKQHPQLGGPAPWVSLPPKSAIGVPVEVWKGPRRIEVAPEASNTMAGQAEIYATAMGLALSALEKNGLRLNLRPERKRSWSFSLGKRKVVSSAWGIDAGASALKVVELRKQDDGRLRVTRCWHHSFTNGEAAASPSSRKNSLAKAVEQLAGEWKERPERVSIGVSGLSTLMRRLRLPPIKDKQLYSAVQFETQHVFPVALDDLYWDFCDLDADPSPSSKTQSSKTAVERRVFVLAAKKSMIDALLEPFDKHSLEVDFVHSNALALHNLFQWEHSARNSAARSVYGILDLGAVSSSLLTVGGAAPWFRSMAACGESLTSRLVQQLQLTREQAEMLKRDVRPARQLHSLYAIIDPVINDLLAETQRSLEAYQRDEPGQPLQQLIVVGGGARLHGLMRRLWFG